VERLLDLFQTVAQCAVPADCTSCRRAVWGPPSCCHVTKQQLQGAGPWCREGRTGRRTSTASGANMPRDLDRHLVSRRSPSDTTPRRAAIVSQIPHLQLTGSCQLSKEPARVHFTVTKKVYQLKSPPTCLSKTGLKENTCPAHVLQYSNSLVTL
jgi:hypothetical protein